MAVLYIADFIFLILQNILGFEFIFYEIVG
jgi:hypothetical protein